jgi:hypothetical protein
MQHFDGWLVVRTPGLPYQLSKSVRAKPAERGFANQDRHLSQEVGGFFWFILDAVLVDQPPSHFSACAPLYSDGYRNSSDALLLKPFLMLCVRSEERGKNLTKQTIADIVHAAVAVIFFVRIAFRI